MIMVGMGSYPNVVDVIGIAVIRRVQRDHTAQVWGLTHRHLHTSAGTGCLPQRDS
jgi:hypothetical protein